jgi:hypothetical protein
VEDRVGEKAGPPSGERNGMDGIAVGAQHDGWQGHGLEFRGGGPGGIAWNEAEPVGPFSGGWFVVAVAFCFDVNLKRKLAEKSATSCHAAARDLVVVRGDFGSALAKSAARRVSR